MITCFQIHSFAFKFNLRRYTTGANRVASGWDDSLSDADRTAFAQVSHELMDESDTTDFKCNIPYFELSYERSAAAAFDVTGGGAWRIMPATSPSAFSDPRFLS